MGVPLSDSASRAPVISSDFQFRVARQHIEIGIAMEDRNMSTNGDRANETIDQLADSLASTSAVAKQSSRVLIVGGFRRENSGARE